jgi:hypothetical protein
MQFINAGGYRPATHDIENIETTFPKPLFDFSLLMPFPVSSQYIHLPYRSKIRDKLLHLSPVLLPSIESVERVVYAPFSPELFVCRGHLGQVGLGCWSLQQGVGGGYY